MKKLPPIHATIIGVPTNLGANNMGVEMGPDAIRYQDLIGKLRRAGIAADDAGNVFCDDRWKVAVGDNPTLRYLDEIVRISTDAAQLTADTIRSDRKAIVLGGDHTTCLGAASGASAALGSTMGLIYFDAHGDMNTDQTTPTGNIHGMQLASLMGFGAPELAHIHSNEVKVKPENVLHIGGSDWDQAELDLIAREGIPAFTMQDMLTKTLGQLLPMIDNLRSRVDHIWISLDLDAIDKQYAPAAGMPNQRGLLYREIKMLAEYIGEHCPVAGIDVVEYNPLNDIERKTANLTIELVATFLGKPYSWYTDYLSRNNP